MDLPIIVPTMLQQTIVYKVMHTHQFFIWTTHTAENTTLLDYKKLYTCVQHCNRTCNIILLVQYSIRVIVRHLPYIVVMSTDMAASCKSCRFENKSIIS